MTRRPTKSPIDRFVAAESFRAPDGTTFWSATVVGWIVGGESRDQAQAEKTAAKIRREIRALFANELRHRAATIEPKTIDAAIAELDKETQP